MKVGRVTAPLEVDGGREPLKGYGYIIVEDQWPWPPRCLVRGRGYSVKSKYKLQSNVDCESVVVLISVVLFRLHMKIHARVSSACQARVRRGTSPYRLHTRDRILSLASYSFLYILFTFLAPLAGEDTPSIRAYFISPLKISSETGVIGWSCRSNTSHGHHICHIKLLLQVYGALHQWSL